MKWYYAKHGKQEGPVDLATLQAKVTSGEIAPTDLIWREGMAEWSPAGEVSEVSSGSDQAAATPASTSATEVASGAVGTTYQTPQQPLAQPTMIGAPTNGMAIASMVCGIIGIMLCYVHGLCALPAVICGHVAMKQINNSPTPMGGKGMAVAGLVTGYIGLFIQLAEIIFIVWAVSQDM
ncbi:MAG: GYF domain-containing protein [Akkermansiaceae bacterium]|nr:GYF domain-containing protein [Akkermansiaceae bacterium]